MTRCGPKLGVVLKLMLAKLSPISSASGGLRDEALLCSAGMEMLLCAYMLAAGSTAPELGGCAAVLLLKGGCA